MQTRPAVPLRRPLAVAVILVVAQPALPPGRILRDLCRRPGRVVPVLLEDGAPNFVPLALRAVLRIDGEPSGFRATLCRCGASKHKPYCDTSHVAIGFQASGEPVTQPSEPLTRRDGPLIVTSLKDGPLEATGNLEICSGTGRTILRTQTTYLCRCGGSANKPYCDGTHKKIGFNA